MIENKKGKVDPIAPAPSAPGSAPTIALAEKYEPRDAPTDAEVQKVEKDFNLVRYIWYEWSNTLPLWAAYARQHSPLLLQITTTNPVESWHRSLKKPSQAKKKIQGKFSLEGTVRMVHETTMQWDSRARQRLTASRTKKLPQANRFSALQKLSPSYPDEACRGD